MSLLANIAAEGHELAPMVMDPIWFAVIAGAVFLFLAVGVFIFAVIGSIIVPDSEFWVAPVALAWLAALIQIPVWILWSIKRSRRQPR